MSDAGAPLATTVSTKSLIARRGVRLRGRSIRQHAARGVIVNAMFSILLLVISLVRNLVIVRFLTRGDYGIWGIVMTSASTVLWLKQVGIGDKYVQQDAEDQELAFQKAFTIECIVNGIVMLLLIGAAPVVAAVYGRSELLVPILILSLAVPANVLGAASWVFIRRMQWGKQRLIGAIDPMIGTVTAIALAVAGAGYWSLLVGVLAGAYAGSLVTVIVSPYRLRWQLDREALRAYVGFSWPLFVVTGSALLIAQSALFFGNAALGLAGAGAIALAATISQFAQTVDDIVSGTMYPVVCAVQQRLDLLYESFVKSNRVALIWALPFGFGLALFAPDLVHYGIGDRWRPAIPLLEVFGVFAAIGHFGFNWDDYFRARGDTRPMAWAAAVTMVSFLATAIPLLYIWGIKGFAIGVAVQTVVNVGCRIFFLRLLFNTFDMLRHAARACAPVIPGVVAVLLLRVAEPRQRRLLDVAIELLAYTVITVAATWALERRLLVEMVSYLRRSASPGLPAEALGQPAK